MAVFSPHNKSGTAAVGVSTKLENIVVSGGGCQVKTLLAIWLQFRIIVKQIRGTVAHLEGV